MQSVKKGNILNIIDIQQVTKQYGTHLVLDSISMSIPKGSIFGLLGPNGAGKTSLIRIITGITAPDKGKVLFNGQIFNEKHIGRIGYLPEERGLYKKMKVGDQLLYLARLKGLSKQVATENMDYWIEKMGMKDWLKKPIDSLSKGMQQKVQFVATIIHKPDLIILDEPFTGFDPINANLLKDEILDLRSKGATIIFSTHRMESVEELCSHIAMINQAKIVLEGTTNNLRSVEKTNIYQLTTSQKINIENAEVKILHENLSENLWHYDVELLSISANELISKLAANMNIYHFSAKVPTMNEIFIKALSHTI
ncbi:MAG: ABC transporter ATP-binding protein [Cytophagales bacterium]